MKKSHILTYVVLFFFAANLNAETAAEAIEKDLLDGGIKIIEKDINLYHYFRIPTENSVSDKKSIVHSYFHDKNNRNAWANEYVLSQIAPFWNLDDHSIQNRLSGPGMYFAIDPSASKQYGDTALILKVPKGTKYLEASKLISFRPSTVGLILKEKLIPASQLPIGKNTLGVQWGLNSTTLQNIVLPENIKLRTIIQEILAKNNVQLIEYTYISHLRNFCKLPSSSAFVFIGSATNENYLVPLVPNIFKDSTIVSNFKIQNQTENEIYVSSLMLRFRSFLETISIAKPKDIKKTEDGLFSSQEIIEITKQTYKCARP